MISEMEAIIPKKEILDYLNKVCCFITDEYYYNMNDWSLIRKRTNVKETT